MRTVWICLLLLCGCDLGSSVAQRPHGPSRLPVGELTLSVWLPAGLDEVRLSAADQRRLAELGINHIEWVQRGSLDGATAEQLAMAFSSREGLAMPVYYEAPGFTPYDKLRNWATRPAVEPGFDAAVRERVVGLKARWGRAPGFAGYLVGHEDYRADGYEALARTVRILRSEDEERPAIVVGAISSYPKVGRFLDALFPDGGPANVFQHEHYVFDAGAPARGPGLARRLDRLAEGYDRVARHLRDRNGRWHAIVQVHGETRDGEAFYRPPTGPEISVQAGLALSRGASGVVYFLYSSGVEEVRDERGEVVQVREYSGLVGRDGTPNERYAAVQGLNRRLRAVSAALRTRSFRGGYEARRAPADEPVASADTDLDLGFFGEATGTSHILVVNRRTDAARTVRLEVAGPTGLRDAVSDEVLTVVDGALTVTLGPGEFRLLAVGAPAPAPARPG